MEQGKQPLLNTLVNNVNMDELLQSVERLIADGSPSYLVEINVDVVVKMEKDDDLREIVRQADITLVDGKPLVWVSQLYGAPIKEKISGSDLGPRLCRLAAEKGYTVFIMGGQNGAAQLAAKNQAAQCPGLRVVGTYEPPMGFEKDAAELEKIDRMLRDAHPDLLFVCLGCPKQERWISRHYRTCGATLSICLGATVDFMANTKKRAPAWMSDHGLEWLYRFALEPRRLFKRYFVDDMQFFPLVWKYRSQARRRTGVEG